MSTIALAHWGIRPSSQVRLFEGIVVYGACLASALVLWPWIRDSLAVAVLALAILLLVTVRFFRPSQQCRVLTVLARTAPGYWRVGYADGGSVDCQVLRVWQTWRWVTLQLRAQSCSCPITVTVWRSTLTSADWHQLRVWTAWDIAMSARRSTTGAVQ